MREQIFHAYVCGKKYPSRRKLSHDPGTFSFSMNPSYKYYWMQKKKLYMNRILD